MENQIDAKLSCMHKTHTYLHTKFEITDLAKRDVQGNGNTRHNFTNT